MPQTLHRLVYYSRNRMAGPPDELARTIRTILATSRANNVKVGVTGALMFNSGYFGQVLEGSRAAVESVFERIQQDDRHGDVSLLAFEAASDRSFESWSMEFVGGCVEDAARYGLTVWETAFDPPRMCGDTLLDTLRRLAVQKEHVTI